MSLFVCLFVFGGVIDVVAVVISKFDFCATLPQCCNHAEQMG